MIVNLMNSSQWKYLKQCHTCRAWNNGRSITGHIVFGCMQDMVMMTNQISCQNEWQGNDLIWLNQFNFAQTLSVNWLLFKPCICCCWCCKNMKILWSFWTNGNYYTILQMTKQGLFYQQLMVYQVPITSMLIM